MDKLGIGEQKIQHLTTQAGMTGSISKKLETPQTEMPKDQVSLQQGTEEPPKAKWLFMNYVAADCNLTKFQVANIDQQELVGSDDHTKLVAMIDVGPKPSPMPWGTTATKEYGNNDNYSPSPGGNEPAPGPVAGQWQGARTVYITKDDKMGELNSKVLAEHGDHVDMSNPETLKKFVIDTVKSFPADNVALILNDHGGGWTGAMSDDSDGNFMSVPNIKKALKEAEEVTGKKLDIIGFDACLMAETEVAYELKDVGKILLASEESEAGPGWTYNQMLGGKTLTEAIKRTQNNLTKRIDVGPYEFAKTVVDVNAEHNKDISTFSATDLTKMDQLKDASEELAKAIIETKDKEVVKTAIQGAENYGSGWSPYGDMRDFHQMSRNIISGTTDENLKKACQGVIGAIETAVFANEVNPQQHPESKGLTIYAPTSESTGPDYQALAFVKDTSWQKALDSLGVPMDPTKKGPSVWPDGSPRKQKED